MPLIFSFLLSYPLVHLRQDKFHCEPILLGTKMAQIFSYWMGKSRNQGTQNPTVNRYIPNYAIIYIAVNWYVEHSLIRLFVTPGTAARQASLSFTISWSLLKFMSIESGDAIQPSYSLSLPSPSALNFSQQQDLFQWISRDRITFIKNACSLEEKLWPT